jgi:hypothetical protein
MRGSFYYLRNKCGKKNCKCAKGEKHISLYIQKNIKGKGKIKKTIIPKHRWEDAREMSNRYKDILTLLDEVSDYEWEHIKDKKKEKGMEKQEKHKEKEKEKK